MHIQSYIDNANAGGGRTLSCVFTEPLSPCCSRSWVPMDDGPYGAIRPAAGWLWDPAPSPRLTVLPVPLETGLFSGPQHHTPRSQARRLSEPPQPPLSHRLAQASCRLDKVQGVGNWDMETQRNLAITSTELRRALSETATKIHARRTYFKIVNCNVFTAAICALPVNK